MLNISWATDPSSIKYMLLGKNNFFNEKNKNNILQKYLLPISNAVGTPIAPLLSVSDLYYPTGKSTVTKKIMKEELEETLEYINTQGIEMVIISDAKYFSHFTGQKSIEKSVGKVYQCVLPELGHLDVIPIISHSAIDMRPEKIKLQEKALKAVKSYILGLEIEEDEVFKFNSYKVLQHPRELQELHKHESLAIDIEATGLRFERLELVSISFAWSDHDAVSIAIHRDTQETNGEHREKLWKEALKDFFLEYKGKKIFHNALFDVRALVYHLFMDGLTDHKGRTLGTRTIADENLDDTMILAYLSLNSTSRVKLSLKELAYDFLGDYAEDVTDVLSLPLDDLLVYNSKDTCGTFWLYNKYNPMVDAEDQRHVYNKVFQPSLNMLTNMMIAGIPLDIDRVKEVEEELLEIYNNAISKLRGNPLVQLATTQLRMDASEKYNATHKVKQKTIFEFGDLVFKPSSPNQVRLLLFDIMGYTAIEKTEAGADKADRATIEEFLESETQHDNIEVLESLIEVSKTSIVIKTFLKAFKEYWIERDEGSNIGLLHGNFNIGKVASGRLSSSSPNLQNLPSGGVMGKLIKSCFPAPKGYVFGGSDFNALTQ